ncbi:MAG: ABC transporter permease subunit [Eubacterium sp.]|jgi:NitT/TauT family transport system permease protein|nr:ABC transporter permease subunit [Eubacterium sp.]
MNIKRISSILCLIILVLLWEVLATLYSHHNPLIPAFSQVIQQMYKEFANCHLLYATFVSLVLVLAGYLLSISLALIISIICIKFYWVKAFFITLYKILSPLPSVAILPIILLISGLNSKSIILLILHSVFWPMLASYIIGFTSVPQIFDDFSSNIGFSPIQKYTIVFIPSAFPHILTGLRTSWGRSWRSLISAEAIFGISGATQGLGYYIYYHRAFANMSNVFAGIIIIIIVSLLAEELFSIIENNSIKKWGIIK